MSDRGWGLAVSDRGQGLAVSDRGRRLAPAQKEEKKGKKERSGVISVVFDSFFPDVVCLLTCSPWKPFETWGSAPHPAPAGGLFAFLPPPLGEGVKVHPRTKRRRDQGEKKGKREEGEEKEDESKGKRRG